MVSYFSERENGPKARKSEVIEQAAWGGIILLIRNLIDDGSLGLSFPKRDEDGDVVGCDSDKVWLGIGAEFPDLPRPLEDWNVPETFTIHDLIEFIHDRTGKPRRRDKSLMVSLAGFGGPQYLQFDVEEGQRTFRADVNRIFERSGLAFQLQENGQIVRLMADVIHHTIVSTAFNTSDETLDHLLDAAVAKFQNPRLEVRKESLEKLWDAWERLKTLDNPSDKKSSINTLINSATSDQKVRDYIESEAKALTGIGNSLMIRHTEIGREPIESSELIDYLFLRLFSLIRYLCQATDRAASV